MRTFLIFVLIAVPVVLVVIWVMLLETSLQIAPGTIGLVLVRGRTTGRVLPPGRHFVSPFRRAMIATYPSRETTYLASDRLVSGATDTAIERLDPPPPVRLGDRTTCRLSYTVRFRIDRSQLPLVHERFGPEGVWAVVRDESRRTLIEQLGAAGVGSDQLIAPARAELEASLAEAARAALAAVGVDMTFFSLVDTGLGEADEVVQSAVRARLAVASREAQRMAGAEGVDARSLPDEVLRYRQFEVWRDLVSRWDGRSPLPTGLSPELRSTLPMPAEAETEPGAP
jgi:regulator of protease activity HflC (stomatin/prohibitin superfamily)